jgi:hypothetical protein
MKKLLLFLILFSVIFILNPVKAACPTEGLVPCGTPDCPCQLCHLFVLLNKIINFVLFKLVPPLAVFMLVVGGVMFLFASGSPGTLEQAKKILTAVIMGLIIIYGAWMIVGMFLSAIGLSDVGIGLVGPDKWFKIDCSVQ